MFKFKLSSEDLKLIEKYTPQSFAALKPQDDVFLINKDTYIDILQDELDEAILDHGMIEQNSLNELGVKLQLLYDQLYEQTESQ